MADSHITFQQQVVLHKERLQLFLEQLELDAPPMLDTLVEHLEPTVWEETDCVACANCCRNMSPAFTAQDIKRIATHLRMTAQAFKEKWLYQDKQGNWMNRSRPCQFLDLHTNKCTVYAIRPVDCAGFPHLTKKKTVEYLHVHKQNFLIDPAGKIVGKNLRGAELQAKLCELLGCN